MSVPSSNVICDRSVEGTVISDNTLAFLRGESSSTAACYQTTLDVAWQRIDLHSLIAVQHVGVALQSGILAADGTLGTAVDPTRTLVLSGGQGLVGQALGQSDYAANDVIGEASASFVLTDPSTVRFTRGSSVGNSSWSLYAIAFQ